VLVESDATLVLPGAGRQGEHADISPSVPDAGEAAPLVTVWVALQDVTEVMGPTTILPGSHLRYRTRATLEEAGEEERAGPNYSADGEENGPSRPNLVTLYQDDDNAAAQWAMGEQMDAADRAHEAREDAEFGADIPAAVRLVLSQGDAGIMDCRVRHFGGAYPYLWDGPPRVLLNATFGVAERVRGFTYHQHDERLALRTLADLLAEE
jgi:ectoine hydroxylase-related dioxygenase (phytanoyl-CoA dioxygenase family)